MLGGHAQDLHVGGQGLLPELQQELVHRDRAIGVERLVRIALLEGVENALLALLQVLRYGGQQVVERRLGDDAGAGDVRPRDALCEALLEIDEVQLPGRADQCEDAGGIVLTGDRDRDAVALLTLDLRLGNADGVHAGAQDLHRLVHLLVRDGLTLLRLRLEGDLGTALQIQTEHGRAQIRQCARANEQRHDGDQDQNGTATHELALGGLDVAVVVRRGLLVGCGVAAVRELCRVLVHVRIIVVVVLDVVVRRVADYRGDRAAVHPHHDAGSDLEVEVVSAQLGDAAVDTADGEDVGADLEGLSHLGLRLLGALLRPQNQQVEDRSHGHEEQEVGLHSVGSGLESLEGIGEKGVEPLFDDRLSGGSRQG